MLNAPINGFRDNRGQMG